MKEAKQALKIRILDGAAALFIEKGIENVKTRDLTEYLGISRSHIYHYFPDWQSLCIDALTRYTRAELQQFMDETAGLNPRDKLCALLVGYLPDAPDATWQLYSSLWQRAIHDEAYEALAEAINERWTAFVAQVIEEGIASKDFRPVDAWLIARQLGAMLYGYADLIIIRPSRDKCEQAMADVTAYINLVLGEG
ncbi:TetR/AcrR family transcriptional regulator [Erwinia sp.]|uniref:TetR/AcrR family transcriptional regulator n=1 Tax=Erwinia citreus TaxID=558 RepID=UPI00289D6BF4|nr:TetR/AcrR family transcriptional regulator [Erwinia sp.]